VLFAFALGALGLTASNATAGEPPVRSAAGSSQFGDVVRAGRSITRTVTPKRRFHIRIPGVGSLVGPRGAVTRRGKLVITPYRAAFGNGLVAAGLGVDVKLKGARLRKRLTLTQRVQPGEPGSIPVVAHRGGNGDWDLKSGRLIRGKHIRVVTRRFSFQFPAWFNPGAWFRWLGDRIAASVGGRTSPLSCPAAPDWFSIDKKTTNVHACAEANNDTGGERAQVRIKANRGAVQQVTLAGNRDYAWVDGQPDGLRRVLGSITNTDPSNVVFLMPGDDGHMTVGYRRPAADASYTMLVETTHDSLLLSMGYWALDAFVGDAVGWRVKQVAVAYTLAQCSGALDLGTGSAISTADRLSADKFADVMSCVIREGAEDLLKPDKAFRAALELNDPNISRMSTKQFADELVKTGRRLQSFAFLLKVRSVLQAGWGGIHDTVRALLSGGESTHIDIKLKGRPAQQTEPQQPGPAPGPVPGPSPGPGTPTLPPAEREIVIYNKVTNDATTMREDTPAYLSTVPQNFCKRNGCALPGTDMNSGFRIVALCQTQGARTTNGWDANPIDDRNPGLFESTRWYLMRWRDGRTGFLSEVWVEPQFRGGMGLRGC
jgi:hypothetical protein